MDEKELERVSRKDRERERHRREIVEAAERIFARKGYHATTVEEIAKEAQFAVGTLYNLFKGKDELYRRVIEGFVQDFTERFDAKVLSVEDARAAIEALIELRLTQFDEHREFIRVVFEASLCSRIDPVPGLPPELVEMHNRYTESVKGIFERGIARHTFEAFDPLYLALCLEGVLNAFVVYWSRNEPTEPLSVRIAKVKRAFLGRVREPQGDGAQRVSAAS
jgi:TetR/AcrR family transcriptional regulator